MSAMPDLVPINGKPNYIMWRQKTCEEYCTLCDKVADEFHLGSVKHEKNVRWEREQGELKQRDRIIAATMPWAKKETRADGEEVVMCTLCNKECTEEHVKSRDHMKRHWYMYPDIDPGVLYH